MVERIELKQISGNTQAAVKITPSKSAERDEKRKNFNRQLQKELSEKDKKNEKEEQDKNSDNNLKSDEKIDMKNQNDKEKKKDSVVDTKSGKIDIYI